jgi:hypothetical protein
MYMCLPWPEDCCGRPFGRGQGTFKSISAIISPLDQYHRQLRHHVHDLGAVAAAPWSTHNDTRPIGQSALVDNLDMNVMILRLVDGGIVLKTKWQENRNRPIEFGMGGSKKRPDGNRRQRWKLWGLVY